MPCYRRPLSAFGGVLITNSPIDKTTAEAMHELLFGVAIAPAYEADALQVLKQKKIESAGRAM